MRRVLAIVFLASLAAPAWAGSTPNIRPGLWSGVRLVGWTADGKSFAYRGTVVSEEQVYTWEAVGSLGLLVVADADGKVQRIFRGGREVAEGREWKAPAEVEALWQAAEPEEAGEAWLKAQQIPSPPEETQIVEKLVNQDLTLAMSLAGKGCKTVSLVAELGAARGVLLKDVCAKGERPTKTVLGFAQVVWSPDGTRALVGWNVHRATMGESVTRGHVAVASRKALAQVDLLDAGAGAGADQLAQKLAAAGYKLGHRGKAMAPRPATVVFYAPGYEAEAREVAALVGAAPDSVQPLSWKSPYAITVAAGRSP